MGAASSAKSEQFRGVSLPGFAAMRPRPARVCPPIRQRRRARRVVPYLSRRSPRHHKRACYLDEMTVGARTSFTETEYLALEQASDRKHEFVGGTIVAMAGAGPAHNALASNISAALVLLTRGRGCLTLSSDQRVHVPATKLYTYPDVTVACGERRYDDQTPPSLLNPTLIVEVTSDSTEDFDRGKKFLHYQSIAELRDYVIVSHRERRIDHFQREGDGQWRLTTHTRGDAFVEVREHGGAIAIADVYADVDLEEGRRSSR